MCGKLISGILSFEINHSQPWFIPNVPYRKKQLIRFYESCTMESSFEVRREHNTLWDGIILNNYEDDFTIELYLDHT